MKKLIIIIFLFNLSIKAQTKECLLESCINNTFNNSHLNKWSISNNTNNTIESDTFILIEAKSGDTAFTELEGIVSIIFTKKYSIIAEHEEKNMYILPYKSKGDNVKINNQLPDSISKYFNNDNEVYMDSIAGSVYRNSTENEVFTIKINKNNCLIDWIEITTNEIEDSEDENGFINEVIVKRTIRYQLISNTNNKTTISKLITPQKYITIKNKTTTLNPNFRNYELSDLTNDFE